MTDVTTTEYGLLDDKGKLLLLATSSTYDDPGNEFQVRSSLYYKHPDGYVLGEWLLSGPDAFTHLVDIYKTKGEGTLRRPRLVDVGVPVRIETKLYASNPMKVVQYYRLEL